MANDDGFATTIGCPGCKGVLRAFEEGDRGFVHYVCTVGHSYSLPELIRAKEEQFESGMWGVLSVLEHLNMAYRQFLARGSLSGASAPEIEARLGAVAEYAQRLRDLIERDRPPALDAASVDTEVA